MQKVLVALKLLVQDIAKLGVPTVATAVAGVLAPIVAAVAGANVTTAEVAGWLVIAGAVAGVVENLTSGRAAAHVAAHNLAPTLPPTPPAPAKGG